MKKRVLGIVLVLVMVLSIAAPALAWRTPDAEPVYVTNWAELRAALPSSPYTVADFEGSDAYIIVKSGSNFTIPEAVRVYEGQKIVIEKGAEVELRGVMGVLGQFILEGKIHVNWYASQLSAVAMSSPGGLVDLSKGEVVFGNNATIGVFGGKVILNEEQAEYIKMPSGAYGDWEIVPLPVDETIAGITGLPEIYADEKAEYGIWVDPAQILQMVNGFSVTVTKSSLLDDVSISGMPTGFDVRNTITEGAKITYEIGLATTNINISTDITPLITLTYTPSGEGSAAVTLNEVKIWTRPDIKAMDVIVAPAIAEATATTLVKAVPDKVSKYDLNKDGVVDFSDVVIALRAISRDLDDDTRLATDANGDGVYAAHCDVDDEVGISMRDISEILANYGNAADSAIDPRG